MKLIVSITEEGTKEPIVVEQSVNHTLSPEDIQNLVDEILFTQTGIEYTWELRK